MKFKFKLGMALLFAAITFSTGCKKENNDGDDGNVLCDGNGSSSYLPLAQQNYWEWKQQGSGNNIHKWTVSGTQTFNSVTYTKVKVSFDSGFTETEWYFRVASNGAVYRYSDYYGTGQEYLYVPATATLNQEWEYPVSLTTQGEGRRKVTGTNESLTIGGCSYTGLLKIVEYKNSSAITTYYYKKGLGLVRFNSLVNSDLKTVTLN